MFCSKYTMLVGASKSISGFDPRSIPGCSLWLDAADTATMNSTPTVTTWTDKSGQGNNVVGTATYSSGTMTFNGSTQAFSNTAYVFPSNAYSMFAVYSNTTAPASTAYMNVVYGNGGYPMLGVYGSSKYVSARSVVANTGALSPNIVASNVLVSATYTPSTFSPFINGSAETTLAGTTLAATGIYVGGPTNYFNGSVSEILIYSATLTQTQRQSVEGYLAWKWGLQVQTPVAPVLTPLSISGCALWLDGADSNSMTFSSGTSNLIAWKDKSGLSNNATAYNSPVLTANAINGNPAIATNNLPYFNGSVSVTGTTVTIFSVATTTRTLPNGGSDQRLVSLENGANVDYGRTDGVIGLFNQYTTSSIATWRVSGPLASNAITANTPFLAVSKYDGTNAYLWKNGVAGTLASSASTGTFAVTKYGIGNQANPSGEYWQGYIGEVIIYTNALSDTQRQSVENYLMGKWGIKPSLPATHPFYSLPAFSRVFGPLDIPGCALWLDGADASTMNSTTTVTSWTDKSGLGNTMTGTATFSGSNMTFNGSTQAFSNTSFVFPISNYSMFAVYSNTTAPASTAYMNVVYGNGGYPMLGVYDSSKFVSARSVVANTGALSPNVAASSTMLVSATYTPSTFSPFINGSAETTLAGTTLAATGIYVGGPTNYFNGSVSEILIYSSNLSTTQRQQVEGYLAAKWGLLNNLPGKTLSPLNIPGCALWLDAADTSTLTLSTNNVTQWSDKSGSGNHATQTTTSLQPTTGGSQNGLNTLLFTGKMMTYPTISLSAQTVFCVYLNNTFTPYGWPVHIGPFAFFYAAPSSNVGIGRAGYTDEVLANWSTNGLTTSKYTVYGGTVSVSGSTTSVLYFNGNQVASNTVTSSGGIVYYTIGTIQSGANTVTGYIAEVIVFNSVLGTAQRQSVENYLMSKWGISNVTSHPFKSIPPSTSQPPQFQEVTPGNWKYDWQPYLQRLTAANSGATAVFSSNAVSGAMSVVNSSWSMNLAPNGLIYTFPTAANYVGTINPTTSVYTSNVISTSYSTGGYLYAGGGALHPNGNIYVPPSGSPANVASVMVLTPSGSGGTFTAIASTTNSATDAFFGGAILAPNGMIYFIPRGSAYIGRIDGNGTFTSNSVSGTVPTGNKYGGAALGPNGLIYCIPFGIGSNVGVIDPVANTYSSNYVTMVNTVVNNAFLGGVLAPNGKIYCVPWNQTTVGIIDPVANTFTNGPALSSATNAAGTGYGNQAYYGGCLGPDGKIYCAAMNANTILVIDPTTNTVSYLSTGLTSPQYRGMLMATNGTLYMKSSGNGPAGTSNVATISFTGLSQLPSSNWCLSPYANHST